MSAKSYTPSELESLLRRVVREELEAHRARHTPVYQTITHAEAVVEAISKKRPTVQRWSR